MAERVKGFVVTFGADLTQESAEQVRQLLTLISGVVDVHPILGDVRDMVIRQRVKSEIRQTMYDMLEKHLL